MVAVTELLRRPSASSVVVIAGIVTRPPTGMVTVCVLVGTPMSPSELIVTLTSSGAGSTSPGSSLACSSK